ncbi:MAG: hypothetical protein ABNO52_00490 [Candidatus Shikimatogenerans sp. Tser]|uniref:Pyruvate flavodoxin/ferredoxin oxidoreductase pyrimidine binding domain-containing protein n=1 Tax=Candidatus Shikimatogenerans sp. Tser TaxID=3158568 RepID=A0AAU7QQX1_9FLAO
MITILLSGISGDGIQYISKFILEFISNNIKKKYNIYTYINYSSDIKNPFLKKDNFSNFYIILTKKNYFYIKNIIINLLIVTNLLSFSKFKKQCNKKSIIILFKNRHYIKNIYKNKNIFFFNSVKLAEKLIFKYFLLKNKIYIRNIFIYSIIIKIFNFKKNQFIKFLKKKYKKQYKIFIKFFILGYNNIFIKNKIYIKKKYNINIKIYNGNYFLVKGLIDVSNYLKKKIFYSYYPITPATTISKYLKKKNINIFKSEDEIASIYNIIGSSYMGKISITSTSGPGMSLMQEGINLAIVLELPMVIIDIQRCGPSTGIPTLSEQSDLLLSLYGRHGESILPVYSIKSPIDCYYVIYKSIILSIKYSTPIIILSDFDLANNYNRFFYKKEYNLKFSLNIKKLYYKNFFIKKNRIINKKKFCISGIEQNYKNNKISYKKKNHIKNILYREKKINKFIKKYKFSIYNNNKNILIITWGSLYEIIKYYIINYNKIFNPILSFLHIDIVYPLNIKYLYKKIKKFKLVLFIENNNKQLYNFIYHKNKKFINYYSLLKKNFNFIINNFLKKL